MPPPCLGRNSWTQSLIRYSICRSYKFMGLNKSGGIFTGVVEAKPSTFVPCCQQFLVWRDWGPPKTVTTSIRLTCGRAFCHRMVPLWDPAFSYKGCLSSSGCHDPFYIELEVQCVLIAVYERHITDLCHVHVPLDQQRAEPQWSAPILDPPEKFTSMCDWYQQHFYI